VCALRASTRPRDDPFIAGIKKDLAAAEQYVLDGGDVGAVMANLSAVQDAVEGIRSAIRGLPIQMSSRTLHDEAAALRKLVDMYFGRIEHARKERAKQRRLAELSLVSAPTQTPAARDRQGKVTKEARTAKTQRPRIRSLSNLTSQKVGADATLDDDQAALSNFATPSTPPPSGPRKAMPRSNRFAKLELD
jgi:hypothetical protein